MPRRLARLPGARSPAKCVQIAVDRSVGALIPTSRSTTATRIGTSPKSSTSPARNSSRRAGMTNKPEDDPVDSDEEPGPFGPGEQLGRRRFPALGRCRPAPRRIRMMGPLRASPSQR